MLLAVLAGLATFVLTGSAGWGVAVGALVWLID